MGLMGMETQDISKNEKIVLYGLAKYPRLADKDICKVIDMKQSTFSTIKKKLHKDGYYHTSYDPILQHLGCEMMSLWYVRLNRRTRTEDRLKVTRKALLEAEDLVTILSESNQAVILTVSQDISSHMEVFDRITQLYDSHGFLEGAVNTVMFPFEQTAIFSFFDFAPLLNRIFKIESPSKMLPEIDVDSPKVRCRVTHRDLKSLEKRVYLGLIRFPELSDFALSEKLGCSRQVVRRLRYAFLEEKLIKKRRIVSLEKLGFEILAMTHSRFNPMKPLREREICIKNVAMLQTPIFNIARDPESVMLTPFKNFEEFQMIHERFTNFCSEHDSLKGEPTKILLSIPRIHEIKWLVYEPLVQKVMGI